MENGNSTRTMISPPFTFRRKFTNAVAALPRVRHSSCSWPVWEEEEKEKKKKGGKKKAGVVRSKLRIPLRIPAWHDVSSTTFHRLVDHLPSLLSRTTRRPRVASKPIRPRSPIEPSLNTRERATHDSLLLSTGTSGSRAENRASLEPGLLSLGKKAKVCAGLRVAVCLCLKYTSCPAAYRSAALFVRHDTCHARGCVFPIELLLCCARPGTRDTSETWFSR